jgi:hypothetical protein
MTRMNIAAGALVAATLTLSAAGDVSANCVQPPALLPGLSGGPVWLPPTPGSTAWRAQLNDPRWSGAPVAFFPVLAGGTLSDQFDAQYRVVQAGSQLYVSIQILNPAAPNGMDAVYVGLTGGSANLGAHLFEIAPDTTDPPATDPSGTVPHDTTFPIPNQAGYINYYDTLNRTVAAPVWITAASPPSWVTNVATWTNSPGATWAVTLQIDTSTIASGPLQLFFGARISPAPATTVILTTSPQYTSGTTGAQIGDTPAGAVVTSWVNFDPLGNACPPGIAISSRSIGVWNSTTSTLTNAVATQCPASNPTCTAVPNDFRIIAQNVPASAPSYAIRTRIRVADWGATIADPNAPWEDFGIPANIFTEPTSYFTTTPGWNWAQSGSAATIDYTCTPSGHLYCPWLANAVASGQQHQCMLVEISVAPGVSGGAGWNIQTAAAYRNMEFGTLSTLTQPAKISLKGLQKVTGVPADRDVYLYVTTENLPPHGRAPIELPQQQLAGARKYAMQPPPIPRVVRGSAVSLPATGLLELPLLTGEQALTQAYPTYRILAYYDSGKKVTVKGQVQKVLIPMAPFGFYLNHQGVFYGFKHSLEFMGLMAKEIAPNFYVVHVANEGEFQVRTNVSAEEKPLGEPPPPPPPPVRCTCDMVRSTEWSPAALGVTVLGGLALAIRSRRRKRTSLLE